MLGGELHLQERFGGGGGPDAGLDDLDLRREELGGVVAVLHPAPHQHHRVVGQVLAVLGHGAGEHHHLDRSAHVLQLEGGHGVALAGSLAHQAGDHPAHRGGPAVLHLGQLGQGEIDPGPQGLVQPLQRMVGDVEAQHLLLGRQPGHPVHLHLGDIGAILEAVPAAEVPEQRHDPLLALAPTAQGHVHDLLENPEQALAGVAQPVEGPGLDERLNRPLVDHLQVDPLAEIAEGLIRAAGLPLGDDPGGVGVADVADRGQAEHDPPEPGPLTGPAAARRLAGPGGKGGEIGAGPVDVGNRHLDPLDPALVQVHGRVLELVLDAGEQGGHVFHRVVGLQVGDLVGDVAVAVAVALVEGVVGELLDDAEHLGAQRSPVAPGLDPGHELLPLLGHGRADLLAHGLAQRVGLGQRVAGEPLGHAHHVLLVDHQPVGVGQDLLGVGVEVGHPLAAVLAVGVVVVHVVGHGAGPVQGHQGGDVVEAGRGQRADQGPHRGRLELEHPDGLPPAQHLEGGAVLEVDGVDVDLDLPGPPDQLDAVGDDVEVAQAQEVHLQQAQVLDPVHLVLGDDGRVLDGLARLGLALDGQVVGEGVFGDHHRGGVDAVLAAQPLQALGHLHHPGRFRVGGHHLPQVGGRVVAVGVVLVGLEAVLQRGVAAHYQRRHGLGDPVSHRVLVAQHPGGVAHRGPGLDPAEGHDLGHPVPAVALGRVADHLVAVAGVEVHVDVGHRHPVRVQESLEQQVVADGVQVGDTQGVGHRAPGGGAPARPHPDAALASVADQVPGDEEVGGEPHVVDDVQFVGQPLQHPVRHRIAPALHRPLHGQVLQVGPVAVEPLRHREVGQLGLAELDGHVGPLGHQQRVVAGRGHLVVGEQVPHLRRRLQVVLVAVELEAALVGQQRAGLHAQQDVVGLGVVAVGVVAVVGGQQGRVEGAGDPQQRWVDPVLLGDLVVLHLDEEVVGAEDLPQPPGLLQRPVLVALQQGLGHLRAQAAGGDDQAFAVVGQHVPVAAGLVVVALQEGPTGDLDEVLVADVVLGQQGEVVVELLAALGVAAGVVDAAPPVGALVAGLVGHVGLGADDGLDAGGAAAPVEVQDPVHVAVVGDAQSGLAVAGRGLDHLVEPGGPVEHRVLGVDVKMDE